MASRSVRVWFDPEGDFLEVTFDVNATGYFRETPDDRVMQRINANGQVIGFSILGVSKLTAPLPVELAVG